MNYLSSDRHLFHKNILKYDKNRKFSTMEEHNEYIISEIEKLNPEDTLYFLGDLHFGHGPDIGELLSRVKCKMIWILGNHDHPSEHTKKYFSHICDRMIVNGVLLIHYPPVDFDGTTRYNPDDYDYVIHGHDHNDTGKKHYGYNICYNGSSKLLFNLEELVGMK